MTGSIEMREDRCSALTSRIQATIAAKSASVTPPRTSISSIAEEDARSS
jgi:hypothetical protein